MANGFCHIELSTPDLAAARKFYKGIFKWKVQDLGKSMGGYTMVDAGEGPGGGMMAKHPDQPTAWLPYVEVDDVKKTIAKAKKLGANIVVEFMEIPGGMGAFGVFVDPTGAALGVWEAAKKAKKAAKKAAKKKAGKKKKK